jgi:hypothetical protein|tara:strand:+ start:28 stop:516 length:489 start_codon:yes stop_codon:yes gene_type:complete
MGDMLMRMPVPYEPLKKNRFIFRFPSELGIQEWWISSASRPKYTSTETEIPFLNTSTFVAGRFTWDSMQITFRDPIGPSATQALMEWVRLHSESVTGRQGYAAGYKKDVELEMLDPTGVVVQKWILQSTQLNDADFGSLDYSSNDLADITCTIRFDRAINVF